MSEGGESPPHQGCLNRKAPSIMLGIIDKPLGCAIMLADAPADDLTGVINGAIGRHHWGDDKLTQ
jgi:hypothetical protein